MGPRIKWTSTCNTTVVFEVALDVQSVKLKEKPEAHSLCAGHFIQNTANSSLNLFVLILPNSSCYFLSFSCWNRCFCNLVLPVFPAVSSVIGLFNIWFLIFSQLHLTYLIIFCSFSVIWITFIFECNVHWKTKCICGRFREWNGKSEYFREQTTLKRKRWYIWNKSQ